MNKTFRILLAVFLVLFTQLSQITPALAAGVSPSGGGKFVTGQNFTVTVKASGATFDSLQGTISVTGVAKVVSFSAGSATWLPGKSPSNGGQFVGIVSPTSSLTVATVVLRADKEGSGSVSVSGVRLARSGTEVGSSGGSVSYSIGRAPTPPGGVTVSSATHPDQNEFYGATTATFSWEAPANGADGYAILLDQVADTTPEANITTAEKTITYNDLALGTHYFHIRAHNGDGWSGATHYKINIKEELDETLTPPTILSVSKNDSFANDIAKGTVTGFTISGSSTGLLSYDAVISATPANFPAEQLLSTKISEDGTWSLTIDQPIPSGFYTIVAHAKKDKAISKDSAPAYLEVSVANGGTAKLISEDDLPKKDLTVKLMGITFSTSVQFWWTLIGVVAFAVVVTLIAYAIRQYYKKWRAKKKPQSSKPVSIEDIKVN